LIENRPTYLKEHIPFYSAFPKGYNLDVDYSSLPELLNFDFPTLNGILPLTKAMFDFLIAKPGGSNVVEVNPSKAEYEYYESIGVIEFQAISIVFNFYALNEIEKGTVLGMPYNVSLVPMQKRGVIETWNIESLKQHDLREICQMGGFVYTEYDPFSAWKTGMGMHYSLFSNLQLKVPTDSIGFQWGLYFLSPIFDKKQVRMPENSTFSKPINAKYRNFKTSLYYKTFSNIIPRRIWGCDSPIELFLLQGLHVRNLKPEIQMCHFESGEHIPNYYKMQESEQWIGEEKLITASDFYFPRKNLAIFCDGSQFHDKEKDEKINRKLKTLGIDALRFTGKEITEELEKVIDKIENKINGCS